MVAAVCLRTGTSPSELMLPGAHHPDDVLEAIVDLMSQQRKG